FIATSRPLGQRLKASAESARATWLLFLQPGAVPDAGWIEETISFIEQAELGGRAEPQAAVFRPSARVGSRRPIMVEVLALLAAALGALPRPGQGLIISKRFYDQLGGHSSDCADAERDLLARIGRRRLMMLRSGVFSTS